MERFSFKDIDMKNIQEKPDKVGWYLVELNENVVGDKIIDVDYCQRTGMSDGGMLEMMTWYIHNIKQCIFLHP